MWATIPMFLDLSKPMGLSASLPYGADEVRDNYSIRRPVSRAPCAWTAGRADASVVTSSTVHA
jgi:hypothetical protein